MSWLAGVLPRWSLARINAVFIKELIQMRLDRLTFAVMLGEILPYVGVGSVQTLIILVAAHWLFAVPFIGSISLLVLSVAVILAFTLVVMCVALIRYKRTLD
jgi:ABC-type multidrug transport system permease subunit